MRIVNSKNILIYAAGLYSFFINNDATICPVAGTDNCQNNIFSLEGTLTNVNVYCLGTVGVVNMITQAGKTLATYNDNKNVYPGVIALFQLASGSGGGPPQTTLTTSTISKTSTSSPPTASATGWHFKGCYTDTVPARTLTTAVQVPGGTDAMTNELCQSACLASGFSIAGTEYAGECCK